MQNEIHTFHEIFLYKIDNFESKDINYLIGHIMIKGLRIFNDVYKIEGQSKILNST